MSERALQVIRAEQSTESNGSTPSVTDKLANMVDLPQPDHFYGRPTSTTNAQIADVNVIRALAPSERSVRIVSKKVSTVNATWIKSNANELGPRIDEARTILQGGDPVNLPRFKRSASNPRYNEQDLSTCPNGHNKQLWLASRPLAQGAKGSRTNVRSYRQSGSELRGTAGRPRWPVSW